MWQLTSLICVYWLLITLILNRFTQPYYFKFYPNYIEAIILLIQIPLQYMVSNQKKFLPFLQYLHQLFLLSFIGSALLIPAILIQPIYPINIYLYTGYFMLVVVLLIVLHFNIVHNMQLNKGLCFSWIVYRLCLLIYILLTNITF